ncbi:MAG: hypothetical protein QF886_14205 [Planctomycetota bacterium]|jgi:hypothetical protein|nr:hypothetical protein [Planctomycetota bacterium]
MSRVFETVARDGVIVLPEDVAPSARCVVAVMDEDIEAIQKQADLTLPEAKQQRMSELLFKNRNGDISEDEKKELDSLAAEFDAATLKKGQALGILAQLEE